MNRRHIIKCISIIYIYIVALAIFTCLNGCNSTMKWPPNGLYYMKWDSYIACYTNQDVYIQLNNVYVHTRENDHNPLTAYSYVFISTNGEIPATLISNIEGDKGESYTLYTTNLSINNKSSGKYTITQLKIIGSDNSEKVYDLGNINIDVIDGSQPSDIQIGKRTGMLGDFVTYLAEITNNTNEMVTISDLYFELNNSSYDVSMNSGDDFNMTQNVSNTKEILAKHKRTFDFRFSKSKQNVNSSDVTKFVALGPKLLYKINGVNKAFILPTAIYSISVSEEEILKLVSN